MSQFADKIRETTTTTGTGTVNLAGAESWYRTFVAGIGTGKPVIYTIQHRTVVEWEIGLGVVTDASPDTLSRLIVLASSNAGSLVNFSAGLKDVFVPWTAFSAVSTQQLARKVVVATTANIALSGEQTLDGVLTSSSRVLVRAQSTASQNGIYISAAGAWTRAVDCYTADAVGGQLVIVEQGTTNADTLWMCTNNSGSDVVGTDGLVYSQLAGAGLGPFQSEDATLTALAAYNTNGLLAQTAADTFAGRTITGTTDRIAVTNGDGVSGNPTLDIGADVLTDDSTHTLTNKTFNANGTGNSLANIETTDFAANVIDTDATLAANSNSRLATQSAVKQYVDNAGTVSKWKPSCRAASTANVTLATDVENGDTLDGVVLATGDRILVKNQSTAADNGIYVVAASGAPTRATDADAGSELVAAVVAVSEGTTNADTLWLCTSDATITVGVTAINWSSITGSASLGDGTVTEVKLANDAVTNAKLANMANATVKGRKTAGTGDPEDCTLSEILDFIGSAAQGDILYRGATGWARLPAGSTAGQLLKTGGAAANPSWADLALDQVSDVTITTPADNEVLAYDNGSATWINQTAAEAGLVAGPASATDNGLTRFDGTTGKLVQSSGVTIDDDDTLTLKATRAANNVATDGATVTFNLDLGNFHTVTLGGNRTLALSNEGATPQAITIFLKQDATGSRTVTWFSGITWLTGDGLAPTLSTGANKTDAIGIYCLGGGAYYGFILGLETVA